MRIDRALGEPIARAHDAALLDVEVLALRNQVLAHRAVFAADQDLPHAAYDAAELDDPVDLGHRRRVLGAPGLEQLGHARQTAGDVAGLRLLATDLHEHVARVHHLTVAHFEARVGRQRIVRELLPVRVEDVDRRLQLLVAVFHDDELLRAGGVVDFLADRDLLLHVREPHGARPSR